MVTKADMRNTVRRMTARYTQAQMPDTQVDKYLNLAYTIHFPEQFKNLKLTKPLVFLTTPNVDTYQFVYQNGLLTVSQEPPNPAIPVPGNIMVNPPVYCQGYILRYFQDKTTFYNRWPNLSVNQQIAVGGLPANTAYTGTIPSTPFYRAQLDIFGNVTEAMVIISAFDDSGFTYSISDFPVTGSNTGNLFDTLGNNVGTVNYLTGVYSFTPANSAVIPASATIYAAVVPYQSSRPVDVLFYNQQFVFRPCPQQVYQVEFQISQQPMDLIADSDAPELDEWYLFICALASELIYIDFPDPEGLAQLEGTEQNPGVLKKQRLIAQRRTLRQLSTQRAATIFSQPGRPLATWFMGTEYSGTSG
jgi:hypothetical protein